MPGVGLLREQIVVPKEIELAVVSSCRPDEVVCDALGLILLQRHVALITQRQVA